MNKNNLKSKKPTNRVRGFFFRNRRPQHDPLLALNMLVFNFEGGWSRTFNPIKHQLN